jgi:hypothetical protein
MPNKQLRSDILTRPTTAKHYRLDLQIEHANESGTTQEAGVVVLVRWEAGLEPLDQHPQRQPQSHPEMHNTGCIVPSDLLAIL